MYIGGVPIPQRADVVVVLPPTPPMSSLVQWLTATNLISVAGLVTQWTDQSGNGNNALSSSNAPAYSTNGLNGRPTVQFANNYMDIANSASMQIAGGMTFYAVAAYANFLDNNHHTILEKGPHGVGLNYLFGKANQDPALSANRQFRNAQKFVYVNSTPAFCNATDSTFWTGINGNSYVFATVVDKANNQVSFYVNGTLLSTNGGKVDSDTYIPDNLDYSATSMIGARIGQNSSGTEPFQGNLSELLLYSSVHSNAMVVQTSQTLATRWGL